MYTSGLMNWSTERKELWKVDTVFLHFSAHALMSAHWGFPALFV